MKSENGKEEVRQVGDEEKGEEKKGNYAVGLCGERKGELGNLITAGGPPAEEQ